jgi:peptide/nickel transport system permease protein
VPFLVRRISFYVITAWAAVTLNFIIPRMMPGNPAQVLVARFQGRLSPAALKSLTSLFGLNTRTGMLGQYVQYWEQLLHGNLGLSFSYFPEPVSHVIATSMPWTLVLIGVSTVISFVLGTMAGVVIGWRRGSRMDTVLPTLTTFLASVPYFWLGIIAVYLLGSTLHWFPASGGYSLQTSPGWNLGFIGSAAYHAALPAVTIVVSSIAAWLIGMRNMMVTTLSEDYVVMAEAKGLHPRRIMYAYAARNAILPSLAGFAMSLGFVVSGAILTEIVFSYPGIGYVLFLGVSNDDYPLMEGVFLVITLAVLLANFLADIAYLVVDPRTREDG